MAILGSHGHLGYKKKCLPCAADKVVAVVKTKRLRETELNFAKAFENYSVETDLDYTVRPHGDARSFRR